MKLILPVSLAIVLSGLAGAAAPPRPAAAGRTKSIQGVVKAIKGRVVVLEGDKVFSTSGQTQYLLETGRDPREVTRAALNAGMAVSASTKDDGGEAVATMVFIRRYVPLTEAISSGPDWMEWSVGGVVQEVKGQKIVLDKGRVLVVDRQTKYFRQSRLGEQKAAELSCVKKGTVVGGNVRGRVGSQGVAVWVVIRPNEAAK